MIEGAFKRYLDEVRLTKRHGVEETSFYGPLKSLFDAVGAELKPKVTLILHPRGSGAGIPDGGLFLNTKAVRAGQGDLFKDNTLPDRGAVEVKGPTVDVHSTACSPQGIKYLEKYGHVLFTNLRHFALYKHSPSGPHKLDEVILAASDAEFTSLLSRPDRANDLLATAVTEFLTRACLTGVPLNNPQTVANFLASYAREALRNAEAAPDTPALEAVRKALQDALGITFDAEEGRHFFLSTLVQTLFYGLFSGWVLWRKHNPMSTQEFHRGYTVDHLRVPMVDLLFQNLSGPNTLEPLGLKELLDRAVDVLNRIEPGPFFQAFDEEDAVQYFYEPFLAAFDPELRKDLGVWYTPKEIVRYQVLRVDQLLRNELGLPDGLADESVVVLDPCCGTGTYLVEVLALIEERLTERYGSSLAPAKVKQAAMRRIFGFELIPAPYVVAHLQLGLLLNRKHAGLTGNERVQVFLTNALTGWDPEKDPQQKFDLYGLQQEREAALHVKRQEPILVILGNPPYNGYAGTSESAEERALTNAYRKVKHAPAPQGQGLNDLYVRFFRMAERRITEGQPGQGIISFISNYSWLDSLSCTGMRERYLEVFNQIWVDNLNGDKFSTGKTTPEGRPDPSVFSVPQNPEGIQVGTAIATFLKVANQRLKETQGYSIVRHRHFWGTHKRTELLKSAEDVEFNNGYIRVEQVARIGFPFKPAEVLAAYLNWPLFTELVPRSFPGVKTSRDEFLVDIDRAKLESRLAIYFDKSVSNSEIQESWPELMHVSDRFDGTAIRATLLARGQYDGGLTRLSYRPFDVRWLYWEPKTKLLDEKRTEYISALTNGEATRGQQPVPISVSLARDNRRGFDSPLITSRFASLHLIERGANLFPVHVFDKSESPALFDDDLGRECGQLFANLSRLAREQVSRLSLCDSELPFFHALATMHSPAYRQANAGALKQDWPRIPWPKDADDLQSDLNALRKALERSAELGRRLAALLDPETPVPGVTVGTIDPAYHGLAEFARLDGKPGGPTNLMLKCRWGYRGQGSVVMPATGKITVEGDHLTVHANSEMGWHRVPRAVWEYKLGGYQVLKKWLSYREFEVLGRELDVDEVLHVTITARRIAALIDMGPELDAAHAAVCDALLSASPE